MLEPRRPAAIRIVERSETLRRELVRAVQRFGFDVESGEVAPDCDAPGASVPSLLALIDVDAPGAEAWLARPEVRRRAIFLVADPRAADALRERHGFELELLIKPFSIEALDAKLIARRHEDLTPRSVRLDPWLETRETHYARTLERAWQLARTVDALCIEGELGTGRRALAAAIHERSPRAAGPLVVLEETGFATRPGEAFEAAFAAQLVAAREGSVVVVEPGSWPVRIQLALQRALRVGEDSEAPRRLVLTSTSLDALAREGRLDRELHHRLSGPTLVVPPLRDRPRDQERLVTATARRVAREFGGSLPPIDPVVLAQFARAGFPGNRLGLEHRLRQAHFASPGAGEVVDMCAARTATESFDLRQLERETILRALAHSQGNRTHASRALGISVRTLRNKLREYALA